MIQSRLVLQGHQGPIYSVVADQSWIYSAAGDKFIARWNVSSGEQDAFSIKLDKPAYCICLKGDLLVVGCTNGTVTCINLSSKTIVWESNIFGHAIFSLAFDQSNNYLYVGDGEGNFFVLGELGQKIVSFHLACGKIRAISTTNNLVFVGSQDGKLRVFDCENLNEIAHVNCHNGSVNCFLFNEVNNTLYSGGSDGHITLIDCGNYKVIKSIPAHYQTVYDLINVGNKLVSCSLDKSIKIWNREELTVQQKLTTKEGGHNKSVNKIAQINNQSFVSVGDDKQLIIWDLK
jgi:WD40 repeat protein